MDWINLHASILDSPEFIGANPVQRSTWLCLLRFCAGQENAGKIIGAASWGDRKWQQLCCVTLREVKSASDLWRWDGDDLEVNFYPIEKQKEIEAKRKAGKSTVAKRWSEQSCSVDSSAISSVTRSADTEGEGKGNKKEKEKGTEVGQIGSAAAPDAPPKKEKAPPALTDAEWLSALKADPTYSHVNIDHEHGKMMHWCAQKRKQPTRLRFLNWIGRIEKPLTGFTALMR